MSLELGDLVQLNQQRALGKYYLPGLPFQGMGVVVDIQGLQVYVYWIKKGRISQLPRNLLIKYVDKKD
tara:strand:+ start:1239 stop:1442 length:204 start_codon:yes stop_codon:yes gene_type:complete